jgi:hypothetical protein
MSLPLSLEQTLRECKENVVAVYEVADTVTRSTEQLISLNSHTIGSTLKETYESVLPGNPLKMSMGWFGPAGVLPIEISREARTYGSEAYAIVSAAQGELADIVRDRWEAFGRYFVEDVPKQKSGSASVLVAWKTAVDAATMVCDGWQNLGLRVMQVAANNVEAAVALASKTGKLATDPERTGARR